MGEIYPFQSVAATNNAAKPRRLLDQVRDRLRTKHYAYRTEQAYVDWVRRYILFHQKRHPRDMGGPEIESFLTYLATERNVAASTQTQALCALFKWIFTLSQSAPVCQRPILLRLQELIC